MRGLFYSFAFITMTKPRSWKEVLAHPCIESIIDNRKASPDSEDMEIWVNLEDNVDNPVCGTKGGGFYAGCMRDVIDHFSWS